MKQTDKKEPKLYVRIIAGVLVALMCASVVFALLGFLL